jgi:ribosomal protein S18 acetylase RimI-like enzyme
MSKRSDKQLRDQAKGRNRRRKPARQPTIRPFAEPDRDGVVALWAEAFPNDPTHNVSEDMIDLKLKVQPELFLVATVDGAVVGAVMAGFDGVRGWLHRLAVRSSARRLGVATRLVRAAEAALAERGCPKVNLQVHASNHDVVAFYEAIGYSVEDNLSLGRKL